MDAYEDCEINNELQSEVQEDLDPIANSNNISNITYLYICNNEGCDKKYNIKSSFIRHSKTHTPKIPTKELENRILDKRTSIKRFKPTDIKHSNSSINTNGNNKLSIHINSYYMYALHIAYQYDIDI
jgi:hypothetical protein